jgi:hypothetical protein
MVANHQGVRDQGPVKTAGSVNGSYSLGSDRSIADINGIVTSLARHQTIIYLKGIEDVL